jgi:hypothetical protein
VTTERVNRANAALRDHTQFIEDHRAGSLAEKIEGPLLDVTRDIFDPRYGHEEFIYGEYDGTFQGMLSGMASKAMTFAVTQDLMRELELTLEMLEEEGIDWLPMKEHHLPTKCGFILFPYGIKNENFFNGEGKTKKIIDAKTGEIHTYEIDEGCGDVWWIDGFMWNVSERVARDGYAGTPSRGVQIFPLTRWRGREDDRPFRAQGQPNRLKGLTVPNVVASDTTSWKFDGEGEVEWVNPPVPQAALDDPDLPKQMEQMAATRIAIRSIVWATFRWLTDEIWIPEYADRPTRRKAMRVKPIIHENRPEDGDVVIVDLRPERKEALAGWEEGDDPPWWRCRWTVRGHYARRRVAIRDEAGVPVGATRGPDAVRDVTYTYKKVWIEEFVKGPDNMPLVFKDKVGVLNR